ncbi:MAG: cupin domain-containing protein [Deltaproteobacteria bacterium]|nr:cupin domain-containing protein [Deltaproteobacteria bacterium]
MSLLARVFEIKDFERPADGAPVRSVVSENGASVSIVWHVKPGQEVAAHVHPAGQDVWTVIEGEAEYYLGSGETVAIRKGQVAVARPGEVHGAFNRGNTPFVFVSVVSPSAAGYVAAEK